MTLLFWILKDWTRWAKTTDFVRNNGSVNYEWMFSLRLVLKKHDYSCFSPGLHAIVTNRVSFLTMVTFLRYRWYDCNGKHLRNLFWSGLVNPYLQGRLFPQNELINSNNSPHISEIDKFTKFQKVCSLSTPLMGYCALRRPVTVCK